MLSTSQESLINDQQAEAIKLKKLTASQLALCYREGWFKIWVPKELGGLAMDLLPGLALLEEIAYLDASLGWTITLCAGANMFVGYIDPTGGQEVFRQQQVCLGGSAQVGGKAILQNDGSYLLQGHWRYATGAAHLSHFTANCTVQGLDGALLLEDGQPQIRSFYFDRDDVLIHEDWDSFGLEASSSHSFSVEGLRLPADRCFTIDPQAITLDYALYRFPFSCFASCTLFVNNRAMFRKFMDLVEKEFILRSQQLQWFEKYGKSYLKKHDQVMRKFEEGSAQLDKQLSDIWQAHLTDSLEQQAMDAYQQACSELLNYLHQEVLRFYPRCGIVASQRQHPLNIAFRNIFTASQHTHLLKRELD